MATHSAIFSQNMPFRATKMWNEIVKHFKDGICLKRKRWRMKYYESCFSGEEAVAWIHEYLVNSPDYGNLITRSQAVSLCQKFLQQNVIKDILPQAQTNIVGKSFIENHLYSFCTMSSKKSSESSKENAGSLKECSSRKGTPHNKRRKSKLDEVSNVRKPLKDRTKSVNNGDLSETACVNKARQEKMRKVDDCGLVVANDAVIEPFQIFNDTKSQGSCSSKTLCRKWKSECDLSSRQEKPSQETSEKKLIPSNSTSNQNCSILPSDGSCEDSVTNDHATTSAKSKTVCDINVSEDKITDLWKSICLEQLRYAMKITSLDKVVDVSLFSGKTVEKNVKSQYRLVLDVFPKWLISAMKYLIHWPNYCQETHGKDPERLVRKAIYAGFENDVFTTVTDYFQAIAQPLIARDFVPIFTKISGLITTCKLSAIRGLQYAFLLLGNEQLRRLQLLCRFMVKVSKNQALKLSSVLPVRELVIQTFSPCVFCGDRKTPLTEVLGIRITSFVMDNYCEVFKTPSGFRHKVEQRIAFCRQVSNGDNGVSKQQYVSEGMGLYCERVTNQDYEEQKRFVTERALEELLDNIVQDEELNEKQRSKKLKQFQKVYPEIYHRRFPSDSLSLMTQNPSTLRHNIMKPLEVMMKTIR